MRGGDIKGSSNGVSVFFRRCGKKKMDLQDTVKLGIFCGDPIIAGPLGQKKWEQNTKLACCSASPGSSERCSRWLVLYVTRPAGNQQN